MYDWKQTDVSAYPSMLVRTRPWVFDQFVSGYLRTAPLSDKEAEAVPDLISLRILSNVVYFVGPSPRRIRSTHDCRIENYVSHQVATTTPILMSP